MAGSVQCIIISIWGCQLTFDMVPTKLSPQQYTEICGRKKEIQTLKVEVKMTARRYRDGEVH